MTEMVVSRAVVGGVCVVRLRGEVEAGEDGGGLAAALVPGGRATVVDLSDVSFADSSLLHELLHAQRLHTAAGLPLVLAAPSPPVARLLDITNTFDAFAVAATPEEGLRRAAESARR
ncbi:STAS domain-containing protein [Streptomyces sp. J2-1]|uniref:STAS domain-containing protein n=1 Tax=Streptomyces corallincola TaxID=2851888 RepID=UPI001C383FEF|nr:STAS domain-containing protein [Streptomyces corallincola]MBV2354001.1 STAS domain-containing protein [Streptomyces corallincola]